MVGVGEGGGIMREGRGVKMAGVAGLRGGRRLTWAPNRGDHRLCLLEGAGPTIEGMERDAAGDDVTDR